MTHKFYKAGLPAARTLCTTPLDNSQKPLVKSGFCFFKTRRFCHLKVCHHCRKQNPADAGHCYNCGNPLKKDFVLPQKKSFWRRLPSWVWTLIGLAALALFLGLIIGGFWALATVEGFASGIFLAIGIIVFRVFSGTRPASIPVICAVLVGFFALMGAAVDQTGNAAYNKPVEWCMCPAGSSLKRTADASHPLPGHTDITQNFICWKAGEVVKYIDPFAVMGLRFVEYLLLAYGLLGLRRLLWKRKLSF